MFRLNRTLLLLGLVVLILIPMWALEGRLGQSSAAEPMAVQFSHPTGYYKDGIQLKLDVAAPAARVRFTTDGSLLWDSLDGLADVIRKDGVIRTLFAGGATVFAALGSIVYTVWTVWTGSLSASILALMPGWKLLDPLPILDQEDEMKMEDERQDEDDESLESLVTSEDHQVTTV